MPCKPTEPSYEIIEMQWLKVYLYLTFEISRPGASWGNWGCLLLPTAVIVANWNGTDTTKGECINVSLI